MERIVALVPCYNPGELCRPVFSQLPRYVDRILAVNDASTDNTPDILAELGVETLHHAVNRGKGAALLTGFDHLLADGFWEMLLTIDSDGQHRPQDVPRLVAAMSAPRAGLAVGSRMGEPGAMPLRRRLANRLSSGLISYVAGQRIPDSQSGFRLHRRELLEKIRPRLSGQGFELETEVLVLASWEGFGVVAVPIPSIYEEGSNRASRYRPVADSYRIGKVIWRCYRSRRS
ncbi:glycosyltransferase family 2 protein [bacterium]|nr:glycosyltransferase family 2 protein [bacterium]